MRSYAPGAVSARNAATSRRLGRQAGHRERNAANQRARVGGGRGRKAFLFQPRQNEAVDGVAQPCRVHRCRVLDLRQAWPSPRRLECPVLFPGRAFVDPALEQRNLRGREILARLRGRHADAGVGVADTLIDQARSGVARHDRRAIGPRGQCCFAVVEAQPNLTRGAGPDRGTGSNGRRGWGGFRAGNLCVRRAAPRSARRRRTRLGRLNCGRRGRDAGTLSLLTLTISV